MIIVPEGHNGKKEGSHEDQVKLGLSQVESFAPL